MHDSPAQSVHRPLSVDDYAFPSSWHGLKQQIIYLAQFGGGVQVIEGSEGAGKTTFAAWLYQDERALSFSVVEMSNHAEGQSFFSELLRQMGLRPQSAAGVGELLVMLRSYVQSLHRDATRAVVLIDDAHAIVDADLAALMSVMQGGSDSGFGLHLILMAEPGLASRIDQLQLLDVVVHDMSIPGLSQADVQLLIDKAGMGDASAAALWQQSQGLPGKIEANLQSSPATSGPARVPPAPAGAVAPAGPRALPKAHIAAVAFLIGALIWAFAAQKDEAEPRVTRVDVSDLIPRSDVNSEPAPAPVAPAPAAADAEVVEREPLARQASAEDVGQASLVPRDAALPVERDQAVAVKPAPAQQPAAVGEPDVDVAKPSSNQTPALPVSGGADEPVATDVVAASEARLLSSPASGYVLQLMASAAPETLFEFVAAQPNREHLSVYRARRDGKLLHILVEGFYADKAAASAAIANLPPSQRKSGPWPKKIEQIHNDIRAN